MFNHGQGERTACGNRLISRESMKVFACRYIRLGASLEPNSSHAVRCTKLCYSVEGQAAGRALGKEEHSNGKMFSVHRGIYRSARNTFKAQSSHVHATLTIVHYHADRDKAECMSCVSTFTAVIVTYMGAENGHPNGSSQSAAAFSKQYVRAR